MPISATVIRAKTAAGAVDFTVHAVFQAAEDSVFVDEVEEALQSCDIIENDIDRARCLVCGRVPSTGLLHVVIDYSDWSVDPEAALIIVTVYRPDPDRWIDGRIRRP